MRLRLYHKKIIVVCILSVLCVLVWLAVRAKPATEDDIRRSACFVQGKSYLCLVAGKDTVVLSADSVSQQGVWINRHWWWPSCDGRVLTVSYSADSSFRKKRPFYQYLNNADSLRKFVVVGADSLSRLLGRKEIERKELIYYLRSHGIIDEGYNQIAAYAQRQTVETDSLKSRVKKLSTLIKADSASRLNFRLVRKDLYHVSWFNNDDSLITVSCNPMIVAIGHGGEPMIVHTHRSVKPWGVYAVRNVPWGAAKHKKIITVTLNAPSQPNAGQGQVSNSRQSNIILCTGSYDRGRGHDLPSLFAVKGSPVFTQHGRFIGIIYGKEVMQ